MSAGLPPLVAVLLAALVASSARAQTAEEELIRHGVELRKQGRNMEALLEFRRAHALRPTPRAMAQIALAEQALGHWVQAESGLLAVLEEPRDAWIEGYRGPLEAALETVRAHLGTLEIDANVADATITVNDEIVGSSPLPGPLRVVAGIARIRVQAHGYPVVQRELSVPARGAVKAAIVMVSPPAALARQASDPQPGQARPDALDGKAAPAGLSARGARSGAAPAWLRRAGWIALAAAGPLLAGGIAANVIREQKAATYNDDARCYFGDETRDQRCGSYRDAMHTAQTLAVAGYAAGGAALAVAAASLLVTRAHTERKQARVSPRIGGHFAYVAWAVTF